MRAKVCLFGLSVGAAVGFTTACGGGGHKAASTTPVVTETFRAACQAPNDTASAPQSLLDTGCFAASGNAATSLYGYQVNGVLWSDDANKSRWLLLPQGEKLSFDGNGLASLPAQAAVVKQFMRGGRKLETRFLFRDAAGNYNAVTYAWNDEQNDATLVPAEGYTASFGDGSSWEYFSRENCLYCHNPVAGTLLGPRLPQLDRTVTNQAGEAVNQLAQMQNDGVIGDYNATIVPWPDPNSDAPLAARARSYLATNCAFCHMPGGYSGTQVDWRYDTPLSGTGACNVAPSWGSFSLPNAVILAPGNPNGSVASYRIHSRDTTTKMPPVGHAVVDAAGVALIDAWIASLTSCDD